MAHAHEVGGAAAMFSDASALVPSLGQLWQLPGAEASAEAWMEDHQPPTPPQAMPDGSRRPVVHDPSLPPVPALIGSEREAQQRLDAGLAQPPVAPATDLFAPIVDPIVTGLGQYLNTDTYDDSRRPPGPGGLSERQKACTIVPAEQYGACMDPGTKLEVPLRMEIGAEGFQLPALDALGDWIFGD